jgi:hypothetical protein
VCSDLGEGPHPFELVEGQGFQVPIQQNADAHPELVLCSPVKGAEARTKPDVDVFLADVFTMHLSVRTCVGSSNS